MGMVFRLMVFLLMFNLAAGAMILIFGVQNAGMLTGQAGTENVDKLTTSFSTTTGVPVADNSFWYRFMDFVSFGFFNQIKLFVNSTIFAIPTILTSLKLIPASLTVLLNGFISVILILGMFELITGRDLFGR